MAHKLAVQMEIIVPDHITSHQAAHDLTSIIEHIGTHPLARKIVVASNTMKFGSNGKPETYVQPHKVAEFAGPAIGHGWDITNISVQEK